MNINKCIVGLERRKRPRLQNAEKTEEMKNILLELWANIEAEGPSKWWKNERQKPARGGTLSY